MIHKFLRVILLAALCLACSEPVTEPVSSNQKPPSISLTTEFGDPPLAGSIVLKSLPDGGTWAYAIDVRDDEVPEVDGVLSPGDQESLPYSFADPGVHTIRIELRSRDGVQQVDRFVVVNDPSFIREVHAFGVPREEPRHEFEGIAVSEELRRLYVGEAHAHRIFMLSLGDFRTLAVADDLGPRNTLEGFAFDESERVLYVLDKSSNVQVFDGQTLVRTHEFNINQAQHFIAAGRFVGSAAFRPVRGGAEDPVRHV